MPIGDLIGGSFDALKNAHLDNLIPVDRVRTALRGKLRNDMSEPTDPSVLSHGFVPSSPIPNMKGELS